MPEIPLERLVSKSDQRSFSPLLMLIVYDNTARDSYHNALVKERELELELELVKETSIATF